MISITKSNDLFPFADFFDNLDEKALSEEPHDRTPVNEAQSSEEMSCIRHDFLNNVYYLNSNPALVCVCTRYGSAVCLSGQL